MIKIKISYEREKESIPVLKALKEVLPGSKIKYSNNGKYKRVYISKE